MGAGDKNYRAWVGPPKRFDTIAASQFQLLTLAGLRERHTLLDIGCGSLRAGRLFLSYLAPGNYYGIEPEEWVLEEGIREQLGKEFMELKRPTFIHDRDFTMTEFGRQFDYLLAQSILSHTSLEQVERCLDQARQVMTESSVFFATFVEGEKDYDGQEWVYPGIAHFRPETMLRVAGEHGLDMELVDWHHPTQQWAAFYLEGTSHKALPRSQRSYRREIRQQRRRLDALTRR